MARQLVVFGSGAAAENLTRYIVSTGARVVHIGSTGARESIASKLWDDVEEDFPFVFVDDIKNQEDLLAARLKRIEFRPAFDGIDPRSVDAVFEAGDPPTTVYETAREALPNAPIISSVDASSSNPEFDENSVAVRFFHPLSNTRLAEVVSPNDSPTVAKVKALLASLSIRILSPQESEQVTKLITDWRSHMGAILNDELLPATNRRWADMAAQFFDEHAPNDQHVNFAH